MDGLLKGMLSDIMGSDIFNAVYESVTMDLFGDQFSNVLSAVSVLHNNVIKPVAILMMFIYFMVALIDKLTAENFTWDQLVKQMAMLLAAKILIEHGFEILDYLFKVGVLIAEDIVDSKAAIDKLTYDADALIKAFREDMGMDNIYLSWLADAYMFFFLFFPWLLSWGMRICVSIICYSRIIDIYARATFAPIALSDFFHSGLQGTGWRYLKNFLAVSLQGAAILVIAIIFSHLFGVFMKVDKNLFTFVGKALAVQISAIMLMFKSLSFMKETVGTG